MRNVGFVENLARGLISEALVKRHRRELCMAPHVRQSVRLRNGVQTFHERRADAATAALCGDGEPADFARLGKIDARRPDRRVAVEREHVHAFAIAVVDLELLGHMLLVDENREPDAPNRRIVGIEVGDANSDHGLALYCMKKLAILDDYEHAARALADWSILDRDVEITTFHDHLADEAALAARLRDFHIVCVMRERTPFPATLLERLPKLEHLSTSGRRNAAIDLEAAKRRGVVVTGTPILPYPAAEHTWALVLALAKRIPADDRNVRAGSWGTAPNVGLNGKTLGILGLGKLGGQVAHIGRAFGMRVIAWSPNLTRARCDEVDVELVTKEALFKESDFVTVHLQLSPRSRRLVTAAELRLMKPTAYLINTSRGPIVDEAALIAALRESTIAGAGLDVFDTEPLPPGHALRALPNTVVTPHQGYVTVENYRLFFATAVENIRAWLDGRIVNSLL